MKKDKSMTPIEEAKTINWKTCFWGHSWLKWEEVKVGVVVYANLDKQFYETKQRRVCERCGLIQRRDIAP